MKLIVGLGNPGLEYEKTRHNAGFLVLDRLAQRHAQGQPARARFHAHTLEARLPGAGACLLVKPTTYMNLSGQSVVEAVQFYKVDPQLDLLVIVDDVALPCGAIRLRGDGGDGGHNGLSDIARRLGFGPYARLRVGIDQPPGQIPQKDYVLGRFSPEQWDLMQPAIEKSADCAERWASDGVVAAMNEFNVKPQKRRESEADDAVTEAQPQDAENHSQ